MEKIVGRKIKLEKLNGNQPTGNPNNVKIGIPHVEPTMGVKFLLLTDEGYHESEHKVYGVSRNDIIFTNGPSWRVTILT